MTFGEALAYLKSGERVTRAGWNGKGMWLVLFKPEDWTEGPYCGVDRLPFIVMKTVQDQFVPWLASQTDILAEDWKVVV